MANLMDDDPVPSAPHSETGDDLTQQATARSTGLLSGPSSPLLGPVPTTARRRPAVEQPRPTDLAGQVALLTQEVQDLRRQQEEDRHYITQAHNTIGWLFQSTQHVHWYPGQTAASSARDPMHGPSMLPRGSTVEQQMTRDEPIVPETTGTGASGNTARSTAEGTAAAIPEQDPLPDPAEDHELTQDELRHMIRVFRGLRQDHQEVYARFNGLQGRVSQLVTWRDHVVDRRLDNLDNQVWRFYQPRDGNGYVIPLDSDYSGRGHWTQEEIDDERARRVGERIRIAAAAREAAQIRQRRRSGTAAVPSGAATAPIAVPPTFALPSRDDQSSIRGLPRGRRGRGRGYHDRRRDASNQGPEHDGRRAPSGRRWNDNWRGDDRGRGGRGTHGRGADDRGGRA